MATTPPSALTKLRSAIAPTAASSPDLPSEVTEIPSLDQLRSRKKAGALLPNNFLFSSKGTVEYDKLELAEFVCGYLEFCKEQPESSKAPLFKHWHLLMERAITYSWSSVRNFHLSVNNAVEQGRLSWRSFESIRERAQTFFTHQDLRSSQPNSSRNGSQPARGKAKDFLCKEWNYTGKCSCAISDAPDLKVWTKLGYLESRSRPVFSGADNHSCRFCAALKLCMCTRTNPGNASVALVWKVKVCTKLGSLESRQRPVFSGADNHNCTFRPALKLCMCTRTDPGNANFANRRPRDTPQKCRLFAANRGSKSARKAELWQIWQGHLNRAFSEILQRWDQGKPLEKKAEFRASKTPRRKSYHLLISMHFKCKHRIPFCCKRRLQKCPQSRGMTNVARTPKSRNFF